MGLSTALLGTADERLTPQVISLSAGERVSNFLQVPLAIEQLIGFGWLVCLDSFLYIFTILPIRSLLAFYALGSTSLSSWFGKGPRKYVSLSPLSYLDCEESTDACRRRSTDA